VGGWVLSYQHNSRIVRQGGILLYNGKDFQFFAAIEDGLQGYAMTPAPRSSFDHLDDEMCPERRLGFSFVYNNLRHWQLIIPFWFPTTLFAALLWPVWQMTRPKPIGRGFPVEITQPDRQEQ